MFTRSCVTFNGPISPLVEDLSATDGVDCLFQLPFCALTNFLTSKKYYPRDELTVDQVHTTQK